MLEIKNLLPKTYHRSVIIITQVLTQGMQTRTAWIKIAWTGNTQTIKSKSWLTAYKMIPIIKRGCNPVDSNRKCQLRGYQLLTDGNHHTLKRNRDKKTWKTC